MKKTLVSLLAIMATSGAMAACYGDGCSCDGDNCRTKKYRVINIITGVPGHMYGEPTAAAMPDEAQPQPVVVQSMPEHFDTYVGARLDLNLLNFKTKYKATPTAAIDDASADHDSYSFEPVFGGNLFVGKIFSPSWRGDIELGYITKFTDSGEGISLNLSAPYILGNIYHDFAGGVYLGVGIGLAYPEISTDWAYYTSDDAAKSKLSLMGAAMLGYSHHLSSNVVLDLRYRLAAFNGPDISRGVEEFQIVGNPALESLKIDVKTVWDNSFSIGVRYEF